MASRTVFARTALSARAGSALPSSARLAHPATGLFLAGAAPRSLAWNSLAARASARAGAPVGQSVRALHTSPVSLELLTRYTKDHEWITYDTESNVGTMGITDHAQNTLGDTTFIDLPSLGTEFEAGDSIGSVESVKAASDIYAPVSGVVEEVNETLADQPGLINKSAEEKGWLIKVRLANPSEVSNLLAKETYETLVQEESDA